MPPKKKRLKPSQVPLNSDSEHDSGDAESTGKKSCCVCEEIIMDTGRKNRQLCSVKAFVNCMALPSCAGLSVPAFEKVYVM